MLLLRITPLSQKEFVFYRVSSYSNQINKIKYSLILVLTLDLWYTEMLFSVENSSNISTLIMVSIQCQRKQSSIALLYCGNCFETLLRQTLSDEFRLPKVAFYMVHTLIVLFFILHEAYLCLIFTSQHAQRISYVSNGKT